MKLPPKQWLLDGDSDPTQVVRAAATLVNTCERCAVSWLRDVDPDEDARDPREMQRTSLAKAEAATRRLLDGIIKARTAAADLRD